jgi:hypothetical protein
MPGKIIPSSSPLTRKKQASSFKAKRVRQVAAEARQPNRV